MQTDRFDKLFTLRPWRGVGITLYATGTDARGATTVEVVVRERGFTVFGPGRKGMRLTGALSPFVSDDGPEARAYALSYAGTKPGDTDADFFDAYTKGQREWVEDNGERLAMLRFDRYGDD